jgi:Flp pilus assembly protein TadD
VPALSPAIGIEPPPLLGTAPEAELLAAALAREPGNLAARTRLVGRLVRLDRFDEAVALTAGLADDHGSLTLILHHCRALFALGQAGGALALLKTQLAQTWPAPDRARLLAEQAKARFRLGQDGAAEADLTAALTLDPASQAAFKRLVNGMLREGRIADAAALVENLQARGVSHTRLLGALALVRAGAGEHDAARALLGAGWLPPVPALRVPSHWPNLAGLNAAAVAEVLEDPALRFDRHGTASRQTWRVDHPGRASAPAITALLAAITGAVGEWLAAIPVRDQPWLALCPPRLALRSWCVITGADGFEQWHMHPEGWLSGGYYLAVPKAVAKGSAAAGCLAFGMPAGLIGAAAAGAYGEERVRPKPGLLTLFPSHAYHRTYPHLQAAPDARRICLAFDLIPA